MTAPKILFFDIETAPIAGYTWEMFDANVVAVRKPTYMLAWAAKWHNNKRVIARVLPDYKEYKKSQTDDGALVKELHGLLDAADIVIAHNADFDIKKTNARFLANALPPPSPYKAFCTLKLARKSFKFDSNKLDTLGGYLGVGRKIKHTGIDLWLGCIERDDPASWATMKRYNTQDVVLLERVFQKMRGYSTNFPDANIWTAAGCCPVCQSGNIHSRGYHVLKSGRRARFQCRDCGNWFQLGRAIKT